MPIFAVCLRNVYAPNLRYFQNYLNIKNLDSFNTIPLVSSLWLTSPRHPLPKDSFSLSLFLGISERGWGWDCCLHSDWTVVVKFHRVSAIGSGWKKEIESWIFCVGNWSGQLLNKRCHCFSKLIKGVLLRIGVSFAIVIISSYVEPLKFF